MTPTSVGITASRHGLSRAQQDVLIVFLRRARRAGATRFHHGCCVGGDEIGAGIARRMGYWVIGHPPEFTEFMSDFVSSETRSPQGYLDRDRALVDEVDVLIGLPNQPEISRGSGTWYTVRYARRVGRPRLVMLPHGQVIDRVGVDEFYTFTRGEFAARSTITDSRLDDGVAG